MEQLLVDNMGSIAALVGAAVLWLLQRYLSNKASLYEKLFSSGVEIAYRIVDDVSKRTENKVDDKVALGLKYLSEWLNAHGHELKPVDAEKAKMLFTAMNGAENKGTTLSK